MICSILDELRQHTNPRLWIGCMEAQENNFDIQIDSGQISTGVEILLKMSHKASTSSEEDIK